MKDFYTEVRYLESDLASFVELVEGKRFMMANNRLEAIRRDVGYLQAHLDVLAEEEPRIVVIEVK